MPYVEEREFALRFELRCEFPDNYNGEQDGYEWARRFRPIATELVHAAVRIVSAHPGWAIRPGNRGRSTEDEVTLVVQWQA